MFRKIIVIALFISRASLTHADNTYLPEVFTDTNRAAKVQKLAPIIDEIYKKHAKKNHFPGYVYGIILDGKLIYSGSGGYTDLNKRMPVTTQSMFRIASMSKSFTAMAILKLRDEGKLQLDDPVSLYIPAFKNYKLTADAQEISIRDLLTHSEGFPEDNPWGDRHLSDSDDELMALLNNKISLSTPAETQFEYSNLGFATLGLIIKKVSGLPYQEYIAKQIWQPLGMSQAAWEYAKVPPNQLALGYKWEQDKWVKQPMLHDGSYGAMGGMITSLESFSHYVALHQSAWPPRDEEDKGPIKRSTVREMHRPWQFIGMNLQAKSDNTTCPTVMAYGYGLRWQKNCKSRVMVGHSGGLPGFGSHWMILPDYGLGIVLFTNVTYSPSEAINTEVINAIIKNANLKPRVLPVSAVLNARKEALVSLLPSWKGAKNTTIFAGNFFEDNSIASLERVTKDLFNKAGKIISIGPIIPENQLRGYFIIKGEQATLKVSFTLSPDYPALIQKYQIEELPHQTLDT